MTTSCNAMAGLALESGDPLAWARVRADANGNRLPDIKPVCGASYGIGAPSTSRDQRLLERLLAEVRQLRARLEQAHVEREMLRNGHRLLCLTSRHWNCGESASGRTGSLPTEAGNSRRSRRVSKKNVSG